MGCLYCLKEIKNKGSLASHQKSCILNPNRSVRVRSEGLKNYIKSVQKGLVKHPSWTETLSIEQQEQRIKKRLTTYKVNQSLGLHKKMIGLGSSKEKEAERRLKISNAIKLRYKNGWLPKAGRCKKLKYISPIAGNILVDGSWEYKVAQYLDSFKFNWTRNTTRFSYINLKNKMSFYTPDFYLSDKDTYIEVKGYETELDRCKWKQFPAKLQIWNKAKLIELEILER